VVRGSGGYW